MARAAKKRKKEKDEDEGEFKFPEFDEVDYMKREVEGARAAILTVILAVPVALLLLALTILGVPIVAFFVGIGLTVALPRIFDFLPWPKINVKGFERKDWAGHGITFFFSWLAFWILLLNAPFADLTAPLIGGVTVNGVAMDPGFTPTVKSWGANATINATVLENVALTSVVFNVDGTNYTNMDRSGARYSLEIPLAETTHTVTITAIDTSDHVTTVTFQFSLEP